MCYLVAKDRNAHGCFALKTTHGKHLVELKRELNKEVGYKGVQLVTISRPTAYGEYAPYHFVDTGCVLKPLSLLCTAQRSMIRIIECFSRFLAAFELLHMVGAET